MRARSPAGHLRESLPFLVGPATLIRPLVPTAIWRHRTLCFNGHMRRNPWSVPEWKFFVEDACRCLAPGGRLVLDLNEDVARYGARRWHDAAVAAYFTSIGSVVRNRVVIAARI